MGTFVIVFLFTKYPRNANYCYSFLIMRITFLLVIDQSRYHKYGMHLNKVLVEITQKMPGHNPESKQ